MSSSSEQPTRFTTIGRRQILGAAAALVLAPAAVAVAYANPARQDATPGATPGTPGATPEGTPVGSPAAAGATTMSVSMIDLAFEPKEFTIPAGTDVAVTVTNNGVLEHNWAVDGTPFETPIVGSGVVQTVTVNLPAGSYPFKCDVPGHAAAGMVGVLTVA
jgi:uncharacterized cupredoxin-like copper-binding protein